MSSSTICLIIILACIVLFVWKPIPNAVTGVLGCAAMVLLNVCPMATAFSGFSNSTVILMFGLMIVGIAMFETGVAKLVGDFVVKISKGNETVFIFFAGLASAILSSFLSNTAVIAMFLPIISSVAKSSDKINIKNVTLAITMGAMFGGVTTLVGSTPQLTANGIVSEMCSTEVSMFEYLPVGAILVVVYLLYVCTIGRKLGNFAWGKDVKNEEKPVKSASESEKAEPISKFKVIMMLLIFIFMVVSFILEKIDNSLTAVIAGLLCIITGCTSQKTVIKKMDWAVVFLLASCLGLASCLTKSGADEVLSNAAQNILNGNSSAFLIFALSVLATMIISNFITNSTAVVIVLPIALSFVTTLGLNPIAYTLGVVYAANLTFCTPLANAQTAMTLAHGYKFSDYFKYTFLLEILVFVVIIIAVPCCIGLTL